MSFDVNILSTKPVIKAAASLQNDGGGGNLGYMAQGEKEEKEKKQYLHNESIFSQQEDKDIFSLTKEINMPEEEPVSIIKLLTKILDYIKNFVKKN